MIGARRIYTHPSDFCNCNHGTFPHSRFSYHQHLCPVHFRSDSSELHASSDAGSSSSTITIHSISRTHVQIRRCATPIQHRVLLPIVSVPHQPCRKAVRLVDRCVCSSGEKKYLCLSIWPFASVHPAIARTVCSVLLSLPVAATPVFLLSPRLCVRQRI